jgi:hypothetical protein
MPTKENIPHIMGLKPSVPEKVKDWKYIYCLHPTMLYLLTVLNSSLIIYT